MRSSPFAEPDQVTFLLSIKTDRFRLFLSFDNSSVIWAAGLPESFMPDFQRSDLAVIVPALNK